MRFGIFLKEKDGREGELIGEGGVNAFEGHRPTLYYVFKMEHWNYGYDTEFVKSLKLFWRSFPRKDLQIRVIYSSINFRETSKVTELLMATSDPDYERSKKVLQKAGFDECGEYVRVKKICWRYPPFQIKGRNFSLYRVNTATRFLYFCIHIYSFFQTRKWYMTNTKSYNIRYFAGWPVRILNKD
uniref:N-acetyltransferase domain-containing protein n=1 Tax=Annulohypoxylon stygium TaxID=326628 RepID=A0A386RW63_9PEZI|nr:hypothetical protein [Annulohypoxylon stygium]